MRSRGGSPGCRSVLPVWDTDSSGNYVVSATCSNVSGTSAALESMESKFQRSDLERRRNDRHCLSNTVPGADQYWVWNTDSGGNYVSDATDIVSGTSAAMESLETSFNADLNNDGVIGTPPPSDQPLFAYQGTDANGAQLYDVTWNVQGSHPFAVRVLVPQHPSRDYPHSFLYALPVESGLTGQSLGDGLNELASLNVEDQYNATIIEPIFPMYSWYADNPTDATIDYETFVPTSCPNGSTAISPPPGDEKNLLIGFSKSGYGDVDLLLQTSHSVRCRRCVRFSCGHDVLPRLRDRARPMITALRRISKTTMNWTKASLTLTKRRSLRKIVSGFPRVLCLGDVADFNNLLTSQGVMHTLSTTETGDAHSWTGGWVSNAVAGLYGLEQKLNSGASS